MRLPLVLAVLLLGLLATPATARVIQIHPRDADGMPLEGSSYTTLEGIYAEAPTNVGGGYACVVRKGVGGCLKGYTPIPPFNLLKNVPINAPGEILVGGPYQLVGFSDPETPVRDAESEDIFVVTGTCPDGPGLCSANLDAFQAAACAVQRASVTMLGLRVFSFLSQATAAMVTPWAVGLGGFGGFVVAATIKFAVHEVGAAIFPKAFTFATGTALAQEAEAHHRALCSPPAPFGARRAAPSFLAAAADFDEVEPPHFSPVPPPEDPGDRALFVAYDRQAAYAGAIATALERYRAAEGAGATEAMARQLRAVADFDRELVAAMNDAAPAVRAFADRLAAEDGADEPVSQEQIDAFEAVQARVADEGLSAAERAELVALGFPAERIAEVEQDLATMPTEGVTPGKRPSELVREAADTFEYAVPGLEQLAAEADRAAEALVPSKGAIVIRQATVPAGADARFSYAAPSGGFDLADGESRTLVADPGVTTVAANAAEGYSVSSVTCDDGASADPSEVSDYSAAVHLEPGETVTCTFTHTRDATISVRVATTPDDKTGRRFVFDMDGGPSPFDLLGGEQKEAKVPAGEAYSYTEGGNGELGFYIVSDGTGTPYRVRIRPPCFALTAGLSKLINGNMLSDIVPTFGSLNMIGGECDH